MKEEESVLSLCMELIMAQGKETSRNLIFWPQMLCLGRETKKTEHLGTTKFPQWISRLRLSRSTGEIFFPQMLCLGRQQKKTEHLGPNV